MDYRGSKSDGEHPVCKRATSGRFFIC